MAVLFQLIDHLGGKLEILLRRRLSGLEGKLEKMPLAQPGCATGLANRIDRGQQDGRYRFLPQADKFQIAAEHNETLTDGIQFGLQSIAVGAFSGG